MLRLKKLKLSWWRDLLITVMGVIFALTLTSFYEKHQQRKSHDKAITQIHAELKENLKVASDFHRQLESILSSYLIIKKYSKDLDNGTSLVLPKDSLEIIKGYLENVLVIDSIRELPDNKLAIGGNYYLGFNSKAMTGKYQSSAWSAYSRQTSLLNITKFEVLSSLESAYSVQAQIEVYTSEFKTKFLSPVIKNEDHSDEIIFLWRYLLDNQKLLLHAYIDTLQKLEKEYRFIK